MDAPSSDKDIQRSPDAPGDAHEKDKRAATRTPSVIVAIVAAAVVGLSVFYLLRPEPLLVQGEADATRLDKAARVGLRLVRLVASLLAVEVDGRTSLVVRRRPISATS